MSEPSGEKLLKAAVVKHVLRNYNAIVTEIAPHAIPNVHDITTIDDVILVPSREGAYLFMTDFSINDINIAVNGIINNSLEISITRVSSLNPPS